MWWTAKYQKSPRSLEYNSYTIFELLTEFWEDYYSENKSEMYDLDLPFASLGDPLVDKWEKSVRAGSMPDLMEGLDDQEAEDLIKWSRKAYKSKVRRGMISGDIGSGIGVDSSKIEELLDGEDSFEETF